jgi:hypothetical protein
MMCGDELGAILDPDGLHVGQHGEGSLDTGVGNAVVVEVETNVRNFSA